MASFDTKPAICWSLRGRRPMASPRPGEGPVQGTRCEDQDEGQEGRNDALGGQVAEPDHGLQPGDSGHTAQNR